MRRADRTRRLGALVAVAFALGVAATPTTAVADAADRPDVTQFGGFIASSRSNGLQLTYDSPNLLPTGSPIFQVSLPEALATLNSGPVGYALSSFLFPGPLVADLGAALAASGTETGIPPYPVRSEAFYPSGPTATTTGQQGTEMTAETDYADSRAHTSYAGLAADPAVRIGGIETVSRSAIDGDQLVARTRTTASDIAILGGLISIESVVTDLVATSNGTESASAGRTVVSGASVLGLPVTIGPDGVRFDERPDAPTGTDPTGGALDGVLAGAGPVRDALGSAAGPLNDLLAQVGGARDDALQQLFEASGIDLRVGDAIETIDGGSAQRSASGLSITLNYDGANTPVLTDLLALLPSDALPADNLGPVPFSPQALVNLLKKTHIVGVALAPANVSAVATPAFEFAPTDVDIDGSPSMDPPPGDLTVDVAGSTGTSGSGGFETATPELPPPAAASVVPGLPASSQLPFPLGDAVPALAVFAVLLGAPLFAAGSRRLADATLAPGTAWCPDGLDSPPQEDLP